MSIRFMEVVRNSLRVKRYSYCTEQAYCYWIKYYIRFHNLKHPRELEADHVVQFLTYLAVKRQVASATQNQALNALNFLYVHVLGKKLGDVSRFARAKPSQKIPVVFERDEIRKLLEVITPAYRLPVQLMYGAGLRLMECLRLRIKDIDFYRKAIIVRNGKGAKDRVTVLPEPLIPAIVFRHATQVYSAERPVGASGCTTLPPTNKIQPLSEGHRWECCPRFISSHVCIQNKSRNVN